VTERISPCIRTATPEEKGADRYYRIYDGVGVVYLTTEQLDKIIKEYNKLKKEVK
jgi:hypothetical protein